MFESLYFTKKEALVAIRCLTYNQASYIKDTLEGFAIQQTDFPFVAVVVDDASTDYEQKVIRSYLDEFFYNSANAGYLEWETDDAQYIYTRHKENTNFSIVSIFLKKNMFMSPQKEQLIKEWFNSKYVALCEGDDYWTDPMKLQKQVAFLESHEDFVACAHNSITIEQDTGKMGCFNNWLEPAVFSYEDIISRDWFLPTQSLLYRREVYEKNKIEKSFFNSDYLLQLSLTKAGGLIYYFNDCMGVYRTGVGVSKSVTWYENNLRLLELLQCVKQLSDNKYELFFERRIKKLQQQNEFIMESERNKKNAEKLWYRIRLRLLRCFAKILVLRNPEVVIYKKY